MHCPECESVDCVAIDSRMRFDGKRRRRYKCLRCDARYTTIEVYARDHAKMSEALKRENTVRKVAEKMAALTATLDIPEGD